MRKDQLILIIIKTMNDGEKKHVRSDKIDWINVSYTESAYDEKHEVLTHCHRKASDHDDDLSTDCQRYPGYEEGRKELTTVLIMCMFLPLTVKQEHQPGTRIASTIEHTDPNSEAHEAGMRLALAASKYEAVRTYSWIGAAMRP